MAASSKSPPRALSWWYGAMLIGGLGFGLLGERRPLGNDIFAHPAVLFSMTVATGLLILRAALARPVPEVIPERTLLFGCLAGLAAFLAGNWIAAHILAG
jgi:hypothetical protein